MKMFPLETLDFTIRIGSTPIFSYFDLYKEVIWANHPHPLTYSSYGKYHTKMLGVLGSISTDGGCKAAHHYMAWT